MRIFLVAALALPCLGMTCGPAGSPPPPDDCASPGGEPVAALALGPEIADGQPFEEWGASDTAHVTEGAQGGDMLGVTLQLSGDALPACLSQRTELRSGGEVVASAEVAVNTYAAGPGTRTTSTLWLVFAGGFYPAPGTELEVVTEAGDASASVQLLVSE